MWVRLEDDFDEHPKVVQAGPVAQAMWTNALAWSNRKGTDGFIPKAQVSRLIALDGPHVADNLTHRDLVETLLDLGMFDLADDGYRIHDYHDYQPTPAQRAALSAKRSDAGRKGAQARWNKVEATLERVTESLVADQHEPVDVSAGVAELRLRLEGGDKITSPVKFARAAAERHRTDRLARVREAAEAKAKRQQIEENAGLNTCEHGNVQRECQECRDAAADAVRRAREVLE